MPLWAPFVDSKLKADRSEKWIPGGDMGPNMGDFA